MSPQFYAAVRVPTCYRSEVFNMQGLHFFFIKLRLRIIPHRCSQWGSSGGAADERTLCWLVTGRGPLDLGSGYGEPDRADPRSPAREDNGRRHSSLASRCKSSGWQRRVICTWTTSCCRRRSNAPMPTTTSTKVHGLGERQSSAICLSGRPLVALGPLGCARDRPHAASARRMHRS